MDRVQILRCKDCHCFRNNEGTYTCRILEIVELNKNIDPEDYCLWEFEIAKELRDCACGLIAQKKTAGELGYPRPRLTRDKTPSPEEVLRSKRNLRLLKPTE